MTGSDTTTTTDPRALSWVEAFEKHAARPQAAWLTPLRRDAIRRFGAAGFPTVRDEAWRYTNVTPIATRTFAPADPAGAEAAARGISPDALDTMLFGAASWAAARIVFVDGHLSKPLSRIDPGGGAQLTGLADAMATDRARLEPLIAARGEDGGATPFTALNTAFMADGALLSLPEGCVIERPIQIAYISTGAEPRRVSSPRTIILAGRRSEARIVESYIGTGARDYFTNAVTECVVEEGAVIDHYKIQRESHEAFHVASMHVRLARSSSFRSHSISLGGGLARNDVVALIDGEGAECTLNGLYVVGGSQHVDHHTTIDHARPHGTSHQLFKGVLDGTSRGVFDGVVIVRKGAQKTDSRQENRNLILSDGALVDTKPTLRIQADDVKCSHAATTGQLDEASTFYLRSRAIDEPTARRIMIHAFASDIVRRVKIEALAKGLDALLFDGQGAPPTGSNGAGRR